MRRKELDLIIWKYIVKSLNLFYSIGLRNSFIVVPLVCVGVLFSSCQNEKPYVVLVSFDGFSHEYIQRYDLPNFKQLIEKGSYAESLIPAFPTKTFPNHYTIVTGLYPQNHGLVDNSFYDPERKTVYTMGKRDMVEDPYYYGGTPLWQLVQEHGMKSASYFWVGSEVPVKGKYPDYYFPYDNKTSNKARIQKVKEWLQMSDRERPNFITLYFSLVDSEGHKSGPYSEATKDTIYEADRLLGLLIEVLETSGLPFNLIVTSDHGMYEVKDVLDKTVYLNDILPPLDSGITIVNNATHAHLYFKNPEDIPGFYDQIKKDASQYDVILKSAAPKTWHYNNNSRIGDILIVANPGLLIKPALVTAVRDQNNPIGVHGYDPFITPEMGGIFFAYGANIIKGKKIPSFENIHIYPFIARILGLGVPDIDGNEDVLKILYKD